MAIELRLELPVPPCIAQTSDWSYADPSQKERLIRNSQRTWLWYVQGFTRQPIAKLTAARVNSLFNRDRAYVMYTDHLPPTLADLTASAA